MSIHIIKSGDTLSGIARQYGIKSWQELYNHPSNASFRAKRRNPNLIFPGDRINIPTATPAAKVQPSNVRLGKFAKYQEDMRKELHKNRVVQQNQQKLFGEEFFEFLEETRTDWDNAVFIADRLDDAVKIVNYYKHLKALGLPISDIKGIVPIITQVKELKAGEKFFEAVMKPGGKLGIVLKTAASAGRVVELVGLGLQVFVHLQRQDYYAAAAEIYRTLMGRAIGWAALIDGTESFVSALAGPAKNPKKDERFWKYLKALNPLGLGAAGIDAVGTMLHEMISRDKDPRRMDRLVERLRTSPAQIFLEMGENLDKALTYFEQMPEAEFREVMNIGNFYNWIKYELTGKLP